MIGKLDILRQQYGYSHVHHHADDVVGNRYKRSGSNRRVYLQLFQRHGYERTED